MVLNLFVLLTLVALGLSAPEPNVEVGVKVNVEDNGGNNCCEKSCIFGGVVYPHKCYLKDTCFEMQCIDGTWKYKGFNEDCGDCTFGGEPYVYTFDDLNNTKPLPYSTGDYLTGEYIMTQPGYVIPALFGVNGHFTDKTTVGHLCGYDTDCLNSVTYHELGDKVTVAPTNNTLPIMVQVNGFPFPIGPSVVKIPGTSMLVFKHSSSVGGHPASTNCISVIGSFGLTVSFCAAGPLPSPAPWSYIYAMPALRDVPSGLYGLCNTFTGLNQDCFQERNGTCVPGWACGTTYDDVDGTDVDVLCDGVAETWEVV